MFHSGEIQRFKNQICQIKSLFVNLSSTCCLLHSLTFPRMRTTYLFLHGRVNVRHYVLGLFELSKDMGAFKNHLRDFLIHLKVQFWVKVVNCTRNFRQVEIMKSSTMKKKKQLLKLLVRPRRREKQQCLVCSHHLK